MNDFMSKKDFPRGLSPEEIEEWHTLCDRIFKLYDKMPLGHTKRKVVAGRDDKGNVLMFFKGTQKDLFELRDNLD